MEAPLVGDSPPRRLRLRAEDARDLEVISACLQDAVTRRRDMAYRRREHRFAAIFNRFRWEREAGSDRGDGAEPRSPPRHQRVRTGVHFDGCLAVRSRGLDGMGADAVLSLLAIDCRPGDDGAAEIVLEFAGGAAILMHLECIDCRLHDMSEPWQARARPDHRLDDPAGDA